MPDNQLAPPDMPWLFTRPGQPNALGPPLMNYAAPPDAGGQTLGSAVADTGANAWQWLQDQRAESVSQGLLDPETGLPTQKGLVDAARATAEGVMMGTTAPTSLASRAGFLYDAPLKPQRAFTEDYRAGVPPTDATGRLTTDIEGRPLNAQFITGRRVVGGVDEAVAPAQFDALAEAAIGAKPEAVAPGEIRGDAGRFTKTAHPVTGDAVYTVNTNRTLSQGGRDLATGHELGHMVDELVGQIDPKGLQPELGRVYNTMTTGQERTRQLTRPGDIGYGAEDAPRELMATAIHAYLTNPNYLKTAAPKVAAAIRDAVNSNPRLRDVIQFNTIAGLVVGGSAGVAGSQQDNQ